MFLAIGLILITHLFFPVAGLVWLWRGNEHSPAINYHNINPTQQYALDVVKLNALGNRANSWELWQY